ncbi:MAG: UDP-N-acetylglucosamine 2-epimerase (non-hydrolyzing) [Hyphomicrobiales bacterium]
MDKLRVMTIIGTRPEIIRLSQVIGKLDRFCDHTLVHTGQNYDYELNEIFFNELGIRKPDFFLASAETTLAETIAAIIVNADSVFEQVDPDALLILGDTNSALSAIPAKRRKIPIFHMEAGNRCFDFRVPEEINRRIVDHIADINLPYSTIAREYLLREGLNPAQIIKTGSPLGEVIQKHERQISDSTVLDRLKLNRLSYFVISSHREENVDDSTNMEKLLDVLFFLAEHYAQPVIVSTHPRTRNRLNDEIKKGISPLIKFMPPFGYFDYVNLQMNARAVLSDSGTITEESSLLNFPALNIRDQHERPEGFEEGSVMLTGLSRDRVQQAISILDEQKRGANRNLRVVNDYDVQNVSDKVLRIIQSYTDFVNANVWKKLN